ncbi:M1 family metallopeptidase [Duganella dendranthematis]|uniref:Aminopeptidase N n=1 Tax=Duganella dendranthematis TaxID=2728021 RepID=A0ABX6MBI9_9BURK|nr:M1 family metallopeptidase [Duganella dendranthematis]QJD91242.1 M1 family metallopeptidase [Duganella dendranthematis]
MTRLPLYLAASAVLAGCATTQVPPTDFTSNSGSPRAPEQLAVTFEKVDLALRVDPATKSIRGDAALIFLLKEPLTRIAVELDRNLPIDSASVDGVTLAPAAISNPDGRLYLTLPTPLQAGARTTVRIQYHGVPHVAKHAPWDGAFTWSQTKDGQPWIATTVEGEGCDMFWPCIDHPMGKPQLIDLHITVPSPLVVAGNGVATGMEEKDGWRTYNWRAKNPSTYGVALNIGPYEMLSGDYASRFGNTIPLRMWYLKGHDEDAKGLFAEFTPMLDFFEYRVGPYPFGDEKMGVVETPHLGMEHQTINAYGNGYAKSAYGYDWLLHHELSHEWFGNQMTNADWDDMWLHEGFGSYMQPLYLESLRGERDFQAELFNFRKSLSNKAPVVSGKTQRIEDIYEEARGGPGNDIYTKGALILHTLRNLIGDDAFFTATRRMVYGTATPTPGNFQPRWSSTKEFVQFSNEASGRDLNWFFDAYLYHAALPELVEERSGDKLTLRWKLKDGGAFPMPIEVRVNQRIEKLPMSDGVCVVTVPPHAMVTIDPMSRVLRQQPWIDAWKAADEKKKSKR